MLLIHTIDLQYHGMAEMIASYVVIGPEGPVLVDTGPPLCLEHLERGLADRGMSVEDIRHALVTHIHLDHAGAAGHLARRGVTVYVHEFGAPHLVDPSKLIASARRIYGEDTERLWGSIVPAPESKIVAVRDNESLEVAGLHFTAIETPGHARHHHAYSLATENRPVCFTGDAAGMIIPGLAKRRRDGDTAIADSARFINLPTPPPEFDPQLWMQSVERLERGRYKALYLTHFGAVHTPLAHLTAVKQAIRNHTEFVRAKRNLWQSESAIIESYTRWVRMQAQRAGASDGELASFVSDNLMRMNVMGMARYLTTA